MTEKEIEKLFKSKLDNRELAFNPANWQRMEAILDQKVAAAGTYYWRTAAAILVFGAVVAMAILTSPGSGNSALDAISGPDLILDDKTWPTQINSNAIVGEETEQQPNHSDEEKDALQNGNSGSVVSRSVLDPSSLHNSESGQEGTGALSEVSGLTLQQAGANRKAADIERTTLPESSTAPNIEKEENSFVHLKFKSYSWPPVALSALPLKEDIVGRAGFYSEKGGIKVSRQDLYINLGPVLGGPGVANSRATGILAGLGYRYTLSQGFGIETGLNYYYINNVDITSKSDSVFYRFGRERVETEEVNRRLDYVEIPFSVTYTFAGRHSLGVGGYASVLLNVQRSITKVSHAPKSSARVEDSRQSGYLDEFNRYDVGLSAFYRYSITQRLNVGLHVKRGMVDITHDIKEGYTHDHTNFNTRLLIEYSLF